MSVKSLLALLVLALLFGSPAFAMGPCLQAGLYEPAGGELAAVLSFRDNGSGLSRVDYSVSAFNWDCANGRLRISFLDGPRAGRTLTAKLINSSQFVIGQTVYTRNPDVSLDTRRYQRPGFTGNLTIASYGGGIYSLDLTTINTLTGAVCSFRSNCERTAESLVCPDPASFGSYVFVSDPAAEILHVTSSGYLSACSPGGEFTGWYASFSPY